MSSALGGIIAKGYQLLLAREKFQTARLNHAVFEGTQSVPANPTFPRTVMRDE